MNLPPHKLVASRWPGFSFIEWERPGLRLVGGAANPAALVVGSIAAAEKSLAPWSAPSPDFRPLVADRRDWWWRLKAWQLRRKLRREAVVRDEMAQAALVAWLGEESKAKALKTQ